MNVDKTIASMLLVPVIGLCIPVALYFHKLPDAGLTATEKELVSFSSQAASVTSPQRPGVYTALTCPVEPPVVRMTPATLTATPASRSSAAPRQRAVTAPREILPAISMIYSDGPARLAIIDGHVLQEGSALGAHRVVKIDKKRVLMRTGGKDIWIYIN